MFPSLLHRRNGVSLKMGKISYFRVSPLMTLFLVAEMFFPLRFLLDLTHAGADLPLLRGFLFRAIGSQTTGACM